MTAGVRPVFGMAKVWTEIWTGWGTMPEGVFFYRLKQSLMASSLSAKTDTSASFLDISRRPASRTRPMGRTSSGGQSVACRGIGFHPAPSANLT